MVLSSVALTTFTLAMRNVEILISSIQEYFFCEQSGFDPEDRCTQDYQKHTYPYLTTISFALLGLFPVVNLIYAINLKELKAALPKWQPKLKKKPSQSSDTPKTGSAAVLMATLKRKASNM